MLTLKLQTRNPSNESIENKVILFYLLLVGGEPEPKHFGDKAMPCMFVW
jgi:hypothetical protein